MEILFLFVGLLFVAVGILIVVSEARARRGAWAISGEVIGFSTGKSGASGDPSYYPVAEYVGPDGCRRYVEGSVGSSSPLDVVGDVVIVLVQPGDPEQALIESSLSYVLGAVIALMGLAACVVFFVAFRADAFSIASAAVVTAVAVYKLRALVRKKPMSLQAWREFKREMLRPRVFTEATKGNIPWVDPAAVRSAMRRQQSVNRFLIPLFLAAGVGLMFLGHHLYKSTEVFLQKAARAPGHVVELATNHSSDSHTYAPVVEFEHRGRTYRFKDSIGSNPPSYRPGERVAVLYDPDRPPDARIDRGRWNEALPMFVGGAGALMCVLGLWMIKARTVGQRANALGSPS